MTKLCPRGKAAAKRKFRVYPSAYANAYASKICAGKIKDPSGVKRKDFKGRKPAAMGGKMTQSDIDFIKKMSGAIVSEKELESLRKSLPSKRKAKPVPQQKQQSLKKRKPAMKGPIGRLATEKPRKGMMGGGLMEATARLKRQGLRKGGGICLRGMNRDAIGKNS